ncbi:MAG: hypothetical protein GY841_15810 [FCB group bacterium]|nr:hypothetical protein [FCB group bacterium]
MTNAQIKKTIKKALGNDCKKIGVAISATTRSPKMNWRNISVLIETDGQREKAFEIVNSVVSSCGFKMVKYSEYEGLYGQTKTAIVTVNH